MLLQAGPAMLPATPNSDKMCCCSENNNHPHPTEEGSSRKPHFTCATCLQLQASSDENNTCSVLLGAMSDGGAKPALVRHLRRWQACRRRRRRRKGGGEMRNAYKNNNNSIQRCNKQARLARTTRAMHATTTRGVAIEKRKLRKRIISSMATSNCWGSAMVARLLLADYNDSGMLQARNSNCLRAKTTTSATAAASVALESCAATKALLGLRRARARATTTTTTKVTRPLSKLVKCERPRKVHKLATTAAEQQPTPLACLHHQKQLQQSESGLQVDSARILRANSSDKPAGVPLEQQLITREFRNKQLPSQQKQHCLQRTTAAALQRPAAKANYLQHRSWRNLIGCVASTCPTTTATVINTITAAAAANVIASAPATAITTASAHNCNAHCSAVSVVATKMSTTRALSAKQDDAKATTTKSVCVETKNISAQQPGLVVPCVIVRKSKCRSTIALTSALTVMVKTAAAASARIAKKAIQPAKPTKRDKPTQIKLFRSRATTATLYGNIFTILVALLTLHATVLRCLLFTALTAATATVTAAPFVAQNSLLLLSQQRLGQHSHSSNNNNNNTSSGSSSSSTLPSTSAHNYNHRHTMLPVTLASPATQPPPLASPPIRTNRMMDIEVLNGSSYSDTLRSLSSIIEDAEAAQGDVNQLPIFDFGLPRNITARTGQAEAAIKCRVERLDDKSVSWIRKRDLHILTVATATYTSDKRFQVTSSKDGREWTLHVKSPQARDTGIYECQVNTEPKMSMAFQLNIIEIPADSRAIISGPADLHFKVGSAIILSCHVQQPSVRDIGPIYWYRGEHIITPFELDEDEESNSDTNNNNNKNKHSHSNVGGDMSTPALTGNELAADVTAPITNAKALTAAAAGGSSAMAVTAPHDGLSNDITPDFTARIAMESQLGDTMKSRLRISNAQTTDTGNYTCQPTTASSASVMVHVINDENPAAMQKSSASSMRITTTTTTTRISSEARLPLLLLAAITTIIIETLMTRANVITRTTEATMAIIATITTTTTLLVTYLAGVCPLQQQQSTSS
ncbi:PREDICTED: uncharacterized protein LOC108969060 [Bactrocera latifrons]|uniref:uncharacterized protein LOC108969060 n=1 Tax=Bactrocera latifrons TaxID=174628 RepID=UPI0008DC97A6|nr:PREDICTED: uncharacterized protein LOC108969060 [Bactrocera latifrons]